MTALALCASATACNEPARPAAGADSPTGLAQTAEAYTALCAALEAAGLLPLPASETQLAAARRGITLPQSAWRASRSSSGAPVWQLGAAVTILCEPQGRPTRLLLLLPAGEALAPAALGQALGRIRRLSKTQQQPAAGLAAPGADLSAGPFFFEYGPLERRWKLQPQFSGETCVRIDVSVGS